MTDKINCKINIDKIRNKYYNKTKIEIFTYKEHLLYEKFINEKVDELKEESTKYELINQKVHNKHDKIFRKILDNKQEAANFINKTLKLEIKEENLEKYNSSFITNELINQESDIIYKLKNRNIYFLIEHQTKIDYSMPYRILEYENEILKSAIDYSKLKQKGYKLPLIIPIVLYTGKKKWDAKKYIKEIQENLEGYVETRFARYNVVDVNEFDDNELLNDKSFLTKAMLIEKAKDEKELIMYLKKIVAGMNNNKNLYSEDIEEILIAIINLILKDRIGEKNAKELIKKIKGGNGKVLAVLDMLEENDKKIFVRGRKEGKEEGKEEGKKESKIEMTKAMINENIPIDIISKITKLTKKEINKLK